MTIIVDAVNQFDGAEDSLDIAAWTLKWVPTQLPSHIHLLLSCVTGHSLLFLRSTSPPPLESHLSFFNKRDSESMISQLLSLHNKTLDPQYVTLLLDTARPGCAGSPLWLAIAVEELRVFGIFETLGEKVTSISQLGVSELFLQVFCRLEATHGSRPTHVVLLSIFVSKEGLLETVCPIFFISQFLLLKLVSLL